MPPLGALLVVAGSGLLFSLSPGPSMLYVLSRSIGQGRAAGVASAIGLALGGVALAAVTAMISGIVITESTAVLRVVRVFGGIYLLYLGASMLLSAHRARLQSVEAVPHLPFGTIVQQGFWVEVLNPKTILFFLAFLPGFVDADAGSIPVQMLVLGVLVPLTAIPADLTVSVAGDWIAKRFRDHSNLGALLEVIGSLVVLGLGARTLLIAVM